MITVESFEVEGWEEKQTGLVVLENEEWLLVKDIPVDYVVDGYKIYKKQFINNRLQEDNEKKIERVLKLKGVEANAPEGLTLGSVAEILAWCEARFGLFEFQDGEDDELFYGRINTIEGRSLIIDSIKTDGKTEFEFDCEFDMDEIRVITFESDYFNSIRLLWEDENRLYQ